MMDSRDKLIPAAFDDDVLVRGDGRRMIFVSGVKGIPLSVKVTGG